MGNVKICNKKLSEVNIVDGQIAAPTQENREPGQHICIFFGQFLLCLSFIFFSSFADASLYYYFSCLCYVLTLYLFLIFIRSYIGVCSDESSRGTNW